MWTILTAIVGHPRALLIVGAFATFQLGTWFLLRRWLRQQLLLTASLRSRAVTVEQSSDESGWFHWVVQHFPANRSPALTRDDALKELDRRLVDQSHYALLQRLAVGAPLIGLLITAFGFLNPPAIDQTETLGEIFTAVTPLILGVAYGAMLALLNQALLYCSEQQIDEFRSHARDWFDENIWLDRTSARDDQYLSEAIRNLTSELGHQFRAVETATDVIARSAGALQQCLAVFSSQVEPLPSSLALFKSASEAAIAAFEQLAPMGVRLGEQFTAAVSSFRATVDGGFSNVAKQQEEASDQLMQTATRAHEVILKIEQAASVIEANSRLQKETTDGFHRSVADTILPHHELALEELSRLHALASGLSTTLDDFQGSFSAFAGQSAQLFTLADTGLRQFATAAANLQGAVDSKFEPAARLHQEVLTGIVVTTERTQVAAGRLEEACGLLQTAAADQASAGGKLIKSVDTLLSPAHSLLGRAAVNFDKTAEELTEHVDRLRSSLNGTATNLNTLLPLARQAFNEMPSAINDFRAVVNQQFQPAAQRHADVIAQIGGGVKGLNEAVAELQRATVELRRAADRQGKAAEGFPPACDAVQAAAGELKQVAHSLRGTIGSEMLPAQRDFQTTTDALRRSVETLTNFIQNGVAPATQRLRELDATIAALRDLVRETQPLSVLAKDVSALLDGISRAAEVARTLRDLPRAVSAALAPSLTEVATAVSALEKSLPRAASPKENGEAPRKRFRLRFWPLK